MFLELRPFLRNPFSNPPRKKNNTVNLSSHVPLEIKNYSSIPKDQGALSPRATWWSVLLLGWIGLKELTPPAKLTSRCYPKSTRTTTIEMILFFFLYVAEPPANLANNASLNPFK
jgi:hypothetical protein